MFEKESKRPGGVCVRFLLGRTLLTGSRVSMHTHTVQSPSILELVLPPCCRYRCSFVLTKVRSQLLCNGFGGEKRAVEVKSDYDLGLG